MISTILLLLITPITYSSIRNNCSYDIYPNSPEVYYINLKQSINRNKYISKLLSTMNLRYFRVEGIHGDDVYIPSDLIQRNNSELTFQDVCKFQTNETIENSYQTMNKLNKKYLINGLCTRDIKLSVLYCSMAHLLAIYQAVHSPTATSKYAIIMEDDVYIPVSIDFNALADTAPSGFGILQLMTIHAGSLQELWASYLKDPTQLWTRRNKEEYFSTGIYIINRERLRPVIDAIIHVDSTHPEVAAQFRLIAARPLNRKHVPSECRSTNTTTASLACIPRGRLVADVYIYSLAPTYVSRIPLAYAQHGFKSTVQWTPLSLPKLEQYTTTYLAQLLQHGTAPKPNFPIRLACEDVKMISVPKPEKEIWV